MLDRVITEDIDTKRIRYVILSLKHINGNKLLASFLLLPLYVPRLSKTQEIILL